MKVRCVTLALTAVIVAYLPTTACQCMELLSNSNKCSDWKPQTKQPFVTCIDMCLAQTHGNCYYIEWNRDSQNCYMGRQSFRASRGEGGDCIKMKKETCMTMAEPACLPDTGENMFEGGEEVTGLSGAKECKTVCVLSQKCRAYTWLTKTSTCKVHLGELKRSKESLKNGDKQSQKPNTSRKGRCSIFRAGMNSGNGKWSYLDLQGCIKSVSTGRAVKADWDFWSNKCWLHYSNNKVNMKGDKSNLQLQRMRECKLEEKNLHKTVRRGTGMAGGYQINRVPEAACVELCSRMVNCAAVHFSHSRYGCFFHHVEKRTVSNPDFTLYTFDECALKPTTEMPTTLPTTVTTTTAPITENVRVHMGTLQWSYYRKLDETVKEGSARPESCMECALLCLKSNCTGFTCESPKGEDVCNINVVSNNSYVPMM